MGAYEEAIAREERRKKFLENQKNETKTLKRHFEKIAGRSTSGTKNTFVRKSTGQKSSVCHTCRVPFDVKKEFEVIKKEKGFAVIQEGKTIPLYAEKLTNTRNLIKDREALIHSGIHTTLDARTDTSITVDTSKPASQNVNFSGLTTTFNVPTISKSSNPTNNEFNLNEVKNQEVIYGSESLQMEQNQLQSRLIDTNGKIIAGGVASGSALAIGALALLLLKRGKKN